MAPGFGNNTHTSLASHSCKNSFVLKHECEAKDVPTIVIQIGHFRVPLCLCFKASLSANHSYENDFDLHEMKLHAELIFIRKVSHLDSF